MRDSEIVIALADIASKGKYEVTPVGASHMNKVFLQVAQLINKLEAEEKALEELEKQNAMAHQEDQDDTE